MEQSIPIRFLVATDVHLGHKEKHPVRGNDSFEALEEVLRIAERESVDFVLLGGDLFDEVNPSKETLFRCLNLLRAHVFGNRPIEISVSEEGVLAGCNFYNENVNIGLPVFSIHGNHDYPSADFGKISICDLLHASSYLNYFGKHLDLHHIVLKPLLFTKRNSSARLALYGLGFIKESVLVDLFEQGQVTFEKPPGELAGYSCVFVLHQNRYRKGFTAGAPISECISARHIPEWINLTIWGHEHEAIPRMDNEYGRNIFQPGSTVFTSFIEAEATIKQCVLFTVHPSGLHFQSIPLQDSYRPLHCLYFEIAELRLKHGQEFDLASFLDRMIADAVEQSKSGCGARYKKPVVRIKVEYSKESELIRAKEIENKYGEQLANADKIIVFCKKKTARIVQPVDPQEELDTLKRKSILGDAHREIKDEILEYFSQAVREEALNVYQTELATEMVTRLAYEETLSANEISSRTLADMFEQVQRPLEASLSNYHKHRQSQFSSALDRLAAQVHAINSADSPAHLMQLEHSLYDIDTLLDARKVEADLDRLIGQQLDQKLTREAHSI